MPTKYTPEQLRFVRVLARDEGGDAAYARRLLIADGNGDYNARIRKDNAVRNVAAGRIWGVTPTPKTTNTKRLTPTPNGARAIARAKNAKR